MAEPEQSDQSLVISYLNLRKAIGILGASFPLVLSIGAGLLFKKGIQESISYYYHTGMRDVFVGILCAIGVFLLSYKGYERRDGIAGDLACVGAVGVALFPTTPAGDATWFERVIGGLHLAFASLFFITLAYMSLYLFTKTDQEHPARRKLQRNKVYRACGHAMVLCLVLIAVEAFLPMGLRESIDRLDPKFWLESVAVVAFGISWLTKGEAILKDES
jgi:hypothetical protein